MIKDKLRRIIHARYRVSFSKAGEDIQLRKLLNTAKGKYLDIGCFEPVTFSNTYFFYLRGWSGVVVDPNPELETLFKAQRPLDKFINKGISSEPGILKYYMLPYKMSSMNTFDYSFLEKNDLVKFIQNEIEVPLVTMKSIVQENNLLDGVDFLDVDVEGLDLEVLSSNDWELFRPKLVMVETEKSVEEDLSSDVYKLMISKDYSLLSKLVQSSSGTGNLIFVKNEFKLS
ncbi:methyltransferase, FkbM family [Algoriphagus locisalis]|uniref:Methyltransferase, FkbM family n=1 Tax=Algoriphagus locisalis TaxID=305507 RepID=A0A1I6XRK6_9BACT|nr:FkbM family methyltransferase [Algoriphagus locisalis]SFT40747.1 methyltransferase, FkbM family [Algoriphagus locisalis]